MSISTNKLTYRRNGSTYSINLYTELSDIGSPAHYLQVKANGTNLYAPVSTVSDWNDSYLRCRIAGINYIIKAASAIQTMTQLAFTTYLQRYVVNNASRATTAGGFTLYWSNTVTDTTVMRYVVSNITRVYRFDTSYTETINKMGFICTVDTYPANSNTPTTKIYTTQDINKTLGLENGGQIFTGGPFSSPNWIVKIDTPFVWV